MLAIGFKMLEELRAAIDADEQGGDDIAFGVGSGVRSFFTYMNSSRLLAQPNLKRTDWKQLEGAAHTRRKP